MGGSNGFFVYLNGIYISMKYYLLLIGTVILSFLCKAQEGISFNSAKYEPSYYDMFYPNTCALIQKQEFTESTLKEKLNGKWRCTSDSNVGLFFGSEVKEKGTIGISFYYRDTIASYNDIRLTDTIKNWDEYNGTGFYLYESGYREMPKGKFCLLKDIKKIKDVFSSRSYFYLNEPCMYYSNGVKVYYYDNIYKILQVYDKELIVSSPWGEPVIYLKVN